MDNSLNESGGMHLRDTCKAFDSVCSHYSGEASSGGSPVEPSGGKCQCHLLCINPAIHHERLYNPLDAHYGLILGCDIT